MEKNGSLPDPPPHLLLPPFLCISYLKRKVIFETINCPSPPFPPGARWHQGELSESLHPAQCYLTKQRGRWRWGAALQRRGLGRGHPGDPRETQRQPGRRGRHTEATQDGGADQERARRSVMKGDVCAARCVICHPSSLWLHAALSLFFFFFFSFTLLLSSLSLSASFSMSSSLFLSLPLL